MALALAGKAKWAFLSTAITKLAQPLFTIVLARILSPEDFGLVALAMVMVAFISLSQDMGLKQALIQRKENTPELLACLFWASMGLGVVWFLLIYFFAPLLGSFYHNDQVVPVVRVLGALFLIAPFAVVPDVLLLRELNFKRLFWVDLIPGLVPGLVAIGLGLSAFGAWALVVGTLVGAVLRVCLLGFVVPWRPGGIPGRGEWRRLFQFGGWVSLESLLGWAITYVDQAFVGRFMSVAQVGYYRMGFALALLPATSISQVLARVLFPAFSRVQDNHTAIRQGFERCFGLLAVLTIPMGTALCLFADPGVTLLLGERWAPAVPVMQILALVGTLSSLVNVAPPFYRAIGRADIMPKFFIVRALISIPAYWYGAQQGLVVLTATHLCLALLFVPINLGIAARIFQVSAWSLVRVVLAPLLFSALAAGSAWGAGQLVASGGEAVMVLTGMVVFGLVYAVMLRRFLRSQYEAYLLLIRDMVRVGGK